MESKRFVGNLLVLISLGIGCATSFENPPDWIHHEPSDDAHSKPVAEATSWKLYTDEDLLTGRQAHALCGTSTASETGNARFCLRRERNQLAIYLVPPQKKVRTARCCVLAQVRVDSNAPVSARSALGKPWGRGFNPRFPGASFPIDGTNPRTGIVEPDGLFTQLLDGHVLSARVPVEPEGYAQYTIHLDGIAPLLNELWKHQR